MLLDPATAHTRGGLAAALGAFTIWGLAPLFWFLLRDLDSVEVLAHRVIWSAILAGALLYRLHPKFEPLRPLRKPKVMLVMLVSTALIATNWFVFLWGVTHERVTEVSLGYYCNPLYNVLLGRVFLNERLSGRQALAVALAAFGVGYLTWTLGHLPWVSVILALTFGTYGLVRKIAPMPALPGMFIETGLVAPLCLIYLLFGVDPAFGVAWVSPTTLILLVIGGVLTASPLLLFGIGARRLPYSTMGMLQYLAPSLQLAVGVLVLGESFRWEHAVTFGCIWGAVALYASDAFSGRKPTSTT